MSTAAEIRASEKYNKQNTKQYAFRFNVKTDAAIIARLDSVPNKSDYVRQLILKDIENDRE